MTCSFGLGGLGHPEPLCMIHFWSSLWVGALASCEFRRLEPEKNNRWLQNRPQVSYASCPKEVQSSGSSDSFPHPARRPRSAERTAMANPTNPSDLEGLLEERPEDVLGSVVSFWLGEPTRERGQVLVGSGAFGAHRVSCGTPCSFVFSSAA